MKRADRYLLLAFAFANAVVYSSLLPLWEGFDEPWHYGYVQSLEVTRRLPVLGATRLSQEVWDSMLACPASHVVAHAWPELQTFDRYFALSAAARVRERSVLEAIPRGEAWLPGEHTNYEAQQPPLAYALLAAADSLLANAPIPVRAIWLRIVASCLAALITFLAATSLFQTLGLPATYQALGLFCIFACQMYWATVAHVANDALGLAFTVWFVASCAAFSGQPGTTGALRLALVTSLGLLTKAYFLPLLALGAFVVLYRRVRALPLFAGIVVVLAGPWYLRNLVLYHNVSGLLMTSGGVSSISSLASVDWSHAIPYMLRATLWTGNNSFTSFSSATLNCLLALLAAGVVLYGVQAIRRRPAAEEWSVLGFLAVYGVAVILVAGNDVVFLKGASAGAAPWYTIVLLAPALAIVLTGLSRSRRMGRLISAAIVLVASYICVATYVVKLLPLYGGYSKGRNTLKETLEWYRSSHHELRSMLSTISLAPPFAIYLGTAVIVSLAIAIAVRLVYRLTKLNEKTLVSSTGTW
ncbi:MAG: hypothetical protein P4L56_00430 [Candidatus Sulfopaludibacter sp.]|nr:hypothetical protein [Candidatus Sulfopaludibacter sp.]